MTVDSLPWLKNYPSHVPSQINPYPYESLVDLFEDSVKQYGDLPAYDCMGTSITFDTLDVLTRNFASYLQQELGLRPGARIAIQLPNILQYPIAMFGALRAGLVVVNTNPLYTPREMQYQFADAGVEAIVILANFAHHLEKILPETSIRHVIITQLGDRLGGFKKLLVNGVVKYVKKMVPAYTLPGACSFNDALQIGQRHPWQPVLVNRDDVAFIQYTGGTTGTAKGAVLSHANILANLTQVSTWFSSVLSPGRDIMITALPLYHVYALVNNCLLMLKEGGCNVLIPNARNLKAMIAEMRKHKFTLFAGINTLFNAMLHHPDFHHLDFSQMRLASSGGMALQTSVAHHWQRKTGLAIVEGYGLSETSPVLTVNSPVPGEERLGTIGLPLPNTRLMIANDQEEEVPKGEAGEIYAKGPQVMKGYWNRPDETAEVFSKDGWFKTGDIGVMDEDGFICIVDRKKEMINVSGFKVYPNEIEEVLARHEKVLEVGAVGVKDPRTTEAVKIYVVKRDESLTTAELMRYCRENLAPYKVPKHIAFRAELPKSNVGKVLRRVLKEEEAMV